jgi:uncharacterized protein YbjT (DUF2867 family)
MNLTVFGATGRTGRLIVQQALAAGHEVTILVRTPSIITIQDAHLHVVQGEINDAASVESVIKGAAAVLSVLGSAHNRPTYDISRATALILAAMTKQGVHRLIISAGAGVGDTADQPGVFDRVIGALLRLSARNVLVDMSRTVTAVRAANCDWTIVRVPMLTDAPPSASVRVGYVGKGTGPRLSRSSLATFMLKQVEDRTYIRQAPVISD